MLRMVEVTPQTVPPPPPQYLTVGPGSQDGAKIRTPVRTRTCLNSHPRKVPGHKNRLAYCDTADLVEEVDKVA